MPAFKPMGSATAALWSVLSGTAIVSTLWFWGATIGSPFLPPIPFDGDGLKLNRAGAALFGSLACPLAYLLWIAMARGVVAAQPGLPPLQRLPVPVVSGVQGHAGLVRFLERGFSVLLLFVVPVLLGHLFRIFLNYGWIEVEHSVVHTGWGSHFFHAVPFDQYFGDGCRYPSPGGPGTFTYLPLVNGWAALLFLLACYWHLLVLLRQLFQRAPPTGDAELQDLHRSG